MSSESLPRTHFTRMQDASRADYQTIGAHEQAFARGRVQRLLDHLELLAGDSLGYAIDRLAHSLQSATRAHRDGRDDEYVVCALLHDIGDTLASANHSELAATIVEPYVSERNHWIVKHHGIFQGYYFFQHFDLDRNLRERYRENQYYEDCAGFCEQYDQNCFDPSYQNLPLSYFRPLVEQVFAEPKRSIYLAESG